MAALPSIPQAVAQSYRDLVHALSSLSRLVVIAFLIVAANAILQDMLRLGEVGGGVRSLDARSLLGFLLGAVQQFLLVPYYLAVHRLIIRGEVARSYRLAPRELGFQRFYWLSLAFDVLFLLPTHLTPLFGLIGFGYRLAFTLIFLCFATALFLRLIIIFPAFAVDAPAATLTNAYADTKGRSWRTLGIIVLAHLPVLLPAAALTFATTSDPGMLGRRNIPLDIVGAALGVIMITLLIAIASRLYMSVGDRVKQS